MQTIWPKNKGTGQQRLAQEAQVSGRWILVKVICMQEAHKPQCESYCAAKADLRIVWVGEGAWK